jgi:hypothetical protein
VAGSIQDCNHPPTGRGGVAQTVEVMLQVSDSVLLSVRTSHCDSRSARETASRSDTTRNRDFRFIDLRGGSIDDERGAWLIADR